jgi:hypothetical protein
VKEREVKSFWRLYTALWAFLLFHCVCFAAEPISTESDITFLRNVPAIFFSFFSSLAETIKRTDKIFNLPTEAHAARARKLLFAQRHAYQQKERLTFFCSRECFGVQLYSLLLRINNVVGAAESF